MKYFEVFLTFCMTLLIFAGCTKTQKEVYVPIASAPMGITLSDAVDMISEDDIRTHIKTLSADVMEGRAPGSKGGNLASDYIASQFKQIAQRPAFSCLNCQKAINQFGLKLLSTEDSLKIMKKQIAKEAPHLLGKNYN